MARRGQEATPSGQEAGLDRRREPARHRVRLRHGGVAAWARLSQETTPNEQKMVILSSSEFILIKSSHALRE